LSKPKAYTTVDEAPSKVAQNQKKRTISSSNHTERSESSPTGSVNGSSSSLTDYNHHKSCTNDKNHHRCLNQGALANLQKQLSLFHADPRAMLAVQEMKGIPVVGGARSLGFELPSLSADEFAGMKPVERYKAEQALELKPWTVLSRRG
jgi:hypothetical protein